MEPTSAGEDRRAIEELLARSGCDAHHPSLVADLLICEFGSFPAVLAGSTSRLRRAGADDQAIEALRWCRSAVLLSLRRRALDMPILGTSAALRDYLRMDMGEGVRERFRTLYLNAKNELLRDEEITNGTVDRAPMYAREIVGRAIEIGATSILVVHNHPSGDCRPSRDDVDGTIALAETCARLGITLLDHLIVGRHDVHSLRASGVLGR